MLTDHLNTPRKVTDESGVVVWSWESGAFGSEAANDDPDSDGQAFEFNWRFPGQYFDQETGLHYNYFRYYEPETGRYITSDPIGLNGGINTYIYVGGYPINAIDPTGLIKIYGAWCGPNWTGGYRKQYDQLDLVQRQAALPPIDNLDRCCQIHDITYAECRERYPCNPEARKQCFIKADRKLSGCAKNAGGGQSPMILTLGNPQKRIMNYMADSDPDPEPNAEHCSCNN